MGVRWRGIEVSLIFSMSMFFLSFVPLWISVLFIEVMSLMSETESLWTEWIAIWVIVIVFICSMVVLVVVLKNKNDDANQEYTLLNAKEEKTISVEFLLSYILPLFAFDFTKWQSIVLFLIFFLTLGWLTIRHNHFTVNLVLEFLRYRVYECTIENADSRKIETRIISKNLLVAQVGNKVRLDSINNEFRIDRTTIRNE